jgi:hypothetical protein
LNAIIGESELNCSVVDLLQSHIKSGSHHGSGGCPNTSKVVVLMEKAARKNIPVPEKGLDNRLPRTICHKKSKKYFGQKLKDHLSSKSMQADPPCVFMGLAFSTQGAFTATRTCEGERRPASEWHHTNIFDVSLNLCTVTVNPLGLFEWLKGVCLR